MNGTVTSSGFYPAMGFCVSNAETSGSFFHLTSDETKAS